MALFSGCTERVQTHGWVGSEDDILQQVSKGQSLSQVQGVLGVTPVSSVFDPGKKYYVTRKTLASTSLTWPRVFFHKGQMLVFDDTETLLQQVSITENDCVAVSPVSEKTETHGKARSFWASIFRNLGRMGGSGAAKM